MTFSNVDLGIFVVKKYFRDLQKLQIQNKESQICFRPSVSTLRTHCGFKLRVSTFHTHSAHFVHTVALGLGSAHFVHTVA